MQHDDTDQFTVDNLHGNMYTLANPAEYWILILCADFIHNVNVKTLHSGCITSLTWALSFTHRDAGQQRVSELKGAKSTRRAMYFTTNATNKFTVV